MSRLLHLYRHFHFFLLKLKLNRTYILIFILITGMVILPGNIFADRKVSRNGLNNQPVYIYYFYFTPRCHECLILEQALLKVINGDYSRELKSKRLILKTINLSDPDPESKRIIQELRVRRQLLLLVYGDVIVNLTRDGFRFSETQYEHFREIMKSAIDQALSQSGAAMQSYMLQQKKPWMMWSAEVH